MSLRIAHKAESAENEIRAMGMRFVENHIKRMQQKQNKKPAVVAAGKLNHSKKYSDATK